MGCCHSISRKEIKAISPILQENFKIFLEENCIFGSDKSVHIQKLHSAFLFFLNQKNINVSTYWFSSIDIVKYSIPALVKLYNLTISPGYMPYRDSEMNIINIDTRYVIGLSVIRFQK